jgi:hypothetical protein
MLKNQKKSKLARQTSSGIDFEFGKGAAGSLSIGNAPAEQKLD